MPNLPAHHRPLPQLGPGQVVPAAPPRAPPLSRRARRWVVVAATVWFAVVAGGFGALAWYAHTPAPPAPVVPTWPAHSQVPRDAARPTVVFFAHPECPCTRASLRMLERIVAKARDRADFVVMLEDSAEHPEWRRSDLWHQAETIVGVEVRPDPEGVEARRFGATTSGHTVLFGADGARRFSGGITPARGHEGDSLGRAALERLLHAEAQTPTLAQVFGCALRDAAKSPDFAAEPRVIAAPVLSPVLEPTTPSGAPE